jgi:hypothetical protein
MRILQSAGISLLILFCSVFLSTASAHADHYLGEITWQGHDFQFTFSIYESSGSFTLQGHLHDNHFFIALGETFGLQGTARLSKDNETCIIDVHGSKEEEVNQRISASFQFFLSTKTFDGKCNAQITQSEKSGGSWSHSTETQKGILVDLIQE